MDCDERKDNLMLYALDALEPAELSELRAHLDTGCPECARNLEADRELLSQLALMLPTVTPPAGALQRLLARLAASRGPEKQPAFVSTSARSSLASVRIGWFKPAFFGALAASILWAAVIGPAWMLREARIQARTLRSDLDVYEARSELHDAEDSLRLISAPTVQLVRLGGQGPQTRANGGLIWDPASRRAQFSASNLAAPPPNKMFELWLIDDHQNKVPAGTFSINADGSVEMPVQNVPLPGALAAVAVTDEPGAAPQPTGSFQLLGTVK